MRIEKRQLVKDIGSIIDKSAFLYMITYKGLKVKEFNELRLDLDNVNAECHVYKNRLIRKAAETINLEKLANISLSGDTALVSGKGDPGVVAKALSDFSKKYNVVEFKGGFLDGTVLSNVDVEAISKLPSREVLYAQLLGTLQAPSRNLVSLLNAKLSSIVYVLDAYRQKIA